MDRCGAKKVHKCTAVHVTTDLHKALNDVVGRYNEAAIDCLHLMGVKWSADRNISLANHL